MHQHHPGLPGSPDCGNHLRRRHPSQSGRHRKAVRQQRGAAAPGYALPEMDSHIPAPQPSWHSGRIHSQTGRKPQVLHGMYGDGRLAQHLP